MPKKIGWDNEAFKKDVQTGGVSAEEKQAVRDYKQSQRPPREPYNPAKEKVTGAAGTVDMDRDGKTQIAVEYVSYDGGPRRIQLRKIGTDRNTGKPFATPNLGRIWSESAEKLAQLLSIAAKEIASDRKQYEGGRGRTDGKGQR